MDSVSSTTDSRASLISPGHGQGSCRLLREVQFVVAGLGSDLEAPVGVGLSQESLQPRTTAPR